MSRDSIALVTGANQGVGLHVARELTRAGVVVLLGSRDLAKCEAAAGDVGGAARAQQLDVTDNASIAAAAGRIERDYGRLDVLVNNAAISNTSKGDLPLAEYGARTRASTISLDEVRAIWETNVFGPLAVYQAMLPLLRKSEDARIVNVSSGAGSLSANADPNFPYRGRPCRSRGDEARRPVGLLRRAQGRLPGAVLEAGYSASQSRSVGFNFRGRAPDREGVVLLQAEDRSGRSEAETSSSMPAEQGMPVHMPKARGRR